MAPSRPDIETTFEVGGRRLAYSVYGEGPKVTVLLHGLLFNQRMHGPLARTLAKRGHRVVTLDLLGHGRSDRPEDMGEYSMGFFAQEVVALLDHLGVDEAVIGGTSLGANVTLEVCSAAPERVRGMIVEMPVLDNALIGCALAFTPLMVALTFGEPVMKVVQAAARLIPNEKLPFLLDLGAEWIQQDPRPSAAVLQGLFFGRIAPHRDERKTFEAPTLILGHHRDPIHPFSDADALLNELPNARVIEAGHFFELRMDPQAMNSTIGSFVDDCWKPRSAPARPAKPRAARKKAS